jgi:hypothetical protein
LFVKFTQIALNGKGELIIVSSGKKRLILSMFLILIVSLSISFCALTYEYNEAKAQSYQEPSSNIKQDIVLGAWVPSQFQLEGLQGDGRMNAIHALLSQGFNEYYFVMKDFRNSTEREAVEALLKSTDTTDLKIIIILLPQGEGGSHANYEWKGWIQYFNSLKDRHPSFLGFAVDDFNAVVDIRRLRLMNSMDLMGLSNFSSALTYKRQDVQFYPVMYIETGEFETLKEIYNNYTAGIILVSTLYQNVSHLEKDIAKFSKMFENKPFKFIVYPTKSGFNSPSDRLIMATLSIVSRWADSIIVYVNTEHPVVQDYLHNHIDPRYMSAIEEMERLQVKHEVIDSRRDIEMCTYCLYETN